MSVNVGDKAPDFTLFNQDAEKVSLDDYKGKRIVLLFFPFANTGVCTKEMCTFRDELKAYEDLDAQVLGISVDSHFALKMWQEKNKTNFPLLSDFNKEVAKSYGVLYDGFAGGKYGYLGVAKRSAFVVDKDETIKYAESHENAGEEPSYENIKSALEKLD
ncbi:MAG: redoxin domain-containing protein [Ignavibacteriaceae bacterium]